MINGFDRGNRWTRPQAGRCAALLRPTGSTAEGSDGLASFLKAGLGLFALSLLVTGSASWADEFPRPQTDYSADVSMRLTDGSSGEGYSTKGREYYSGGKKRREMALMGRSTIHIERPVVYARGLNA